MGTNLSQVFVLNTANLETGSTFTSPTAGDVGIWKYAATAGYLDTKLYEITAAASGAVVDTSDAGAAADPVISQATLANPLWLYNELQIVQGTAGNPIASPIINTRNIRSISFDPFSETAGHKVVLTPDADAFTSAAVGDVSVRFVIRTQPTDIMSYHDANATNYTILAGNDPLPLGAFNTTNHKVITIDIAEEDYSDAATLIDKIVAGVQAHGLLSKMISATDGTTTCTLQSKHVGLIFDLVIVAENDDNIMVVQSSAAATANNKIGAVVTAQKLGVGNPWQVLGEEIRCRSRYGNFNRMYLPQNMPTYTADYDYHKITIEYEHNWPTSTGIAPAGALNQIVIYAGQSDGTALETSETNIDAVFNLAAFTSAKKFIW